GGGAAAEVRHLAALAVDRHLGVRVERNLYRGAVALAQRERRRGGHRHATAIEHERVGRVVEEEVDLGMRPATRQSGPVRPAAGGECQRGKRGAEDCLPHKEIIARRSQTPVWLL